MKMVPQNTHYSEYQQSLVQLHRLFAQGVGDSPELDALYEELDIHASYLSPEECDRVGGLSGDLYLLQHDEVYEVVSDPEMARKLEQQIEKASSNGDWVALLELLRKRPDGVPDEHVARLRGHAYMRLEEYAAALPFLEMALASSECDARVQFEYLTALSEVAAYDVAARAAAAFVTSSPDDLFWLAEWIVVLSQVEMRDDLPVEDWYRQAAASFRLLLSKPSKFISKDSAFRFHAYFAFAYACFKSADILTAREAWKEASESIHDGDSDRLLDALDGDIRALEESTVASEVVTGSARDEHETVDVQQSATRVEALTLPRIVTNRRTRRRLPSSEFGRLLRENLSRGASTSQGRLPLAAR